MWQRIQTVFLVIAAAALAVSLVQPIWIFQTGEEMHALTPFYYKSTLTGQAGEGETFSYMPFTLTAVFTIAAITIIITEMRKFKKRVTQMKLGALNSLFLVGVVGCSVYFAVQLIKEFPGGHYGPSMYLPVVAVVCNLIANYFIRKDERLVRDSQRLR
jgi:Co/Zn/Cd efflux system component